MENFPEPGRDYSWTVIEKEREITRLKQEKAELLAHLRGMLVMVDSLHGGECPYEGCVLARAAIAKYTHPE